MCGSRYNTEDSEIARMAKEIMDDYDQATTDFGAAVMTLPVLDGTKHALLGVIGRIKSIEGARAFAEPIDVDKYRDIVKHPMDLSTVERNLQSDQFVVPLLVLYCVYIVVACMWCDITYNFCLGFPMRGRVIDAYECPRVLFPPFARYATVRDFLRDMQRIWDNCRRLNKADSPLVDVCNNVEAACVDMLRKWARSWKLA